MHLIVKILRKANPASAFYYQEFSLDAEADASVSDLLFALNAKEPLEDARGDAATPVAWEHNCDRGQCGSCAMRIQGRPRLACATRLGDVCREGKALLLQPLRKFPVLRDLMVDRDALREHFQTMGIWLEDGAAIDARAYDRQALSADCMQCGCCLDVCPEYTGRGDFLGAATLCAAYRIASQTPPGAARDKILRAYQKHGSCARCMACDEVCPAGIPLPVMLSQMNRLVRKSRVTKR